MINDEMVLFVIWWREFLSLGKFRIFNRLVKLNFNFGLFKKNIVILLIGLYFEISGLKIIWRILWILMLDIFSLNFLIDNFIVVLLL